MKRKREMEVREEVHFDTALRSFTNFFTVTVLAKIELRDSRTELQKAEPSGHIPLLSERREGVDS